MVQANSVYVDEGSGRTWEVVGHVGDEEYLCIGEPEDGAREGAPETRRMQAAEIHRRMSYVRQLPPNGLFHRWKRIGHIAVCIHCDRVYEGTASFAIIHARECPLGKFDNARKFSAAQAERARNEEG